jgi:DNA-binding transcriptional MerR regulator
MASLLSIGRFAALSGLTVKTLRYYDARGLLRPARVDPRSGYRYYRLRQLRDAQVIGLLRSLEMPLDEVRAILVERDTTATKVLLERQRMRLKQRLAAGQRALAFIERLLQEAFPMEYQVEVREIPAQAVVSTRFRSAVDTFADDIAEAIGRVERAAREGDVEVTGRLILLWSREQTGRMVVFDARACLPVRPPAPLTGAAGSIEELAGGRFAVTVHTGPYEELGGAHEAIAAWIDEHGYRVAGPARQRTLTERGEMDPARFRTEVAFPVG